MELNSLTRGYIKAIEEAPDLQTRHKLLEDYTQYLTGENQKLKNRLTKTVEVMDKLIEELKNIC